MKSRAEERLTRVILEFREGTRVILDYGGDSPDVWGALYAYAPGRSLPVAELHLEDSIDRLVRASGLVPTAMIPNVQGSPTA